MRVRALLALSLLLVGGCSLFRDRHKPPDLRDVLQVVTPRVGAAVSIPIRVTSGGAVALQLDLEYEPELLALEQGTTAPPAAGAGKALTARPVRRGVARVVVFGTNLQPLPPGLLGEVRFRAVGSARLTPVRAVRRAAPDAEGRDLATTVRRGEIVIGGA
jgi:hypothetical protein